jgi:two-component sensor histidine kinase
MGYGRELFARRSDGHEFPIETNLNLLPGGKHGLISGAIRDITERRAADERQGLLIRELNHRVKNTLASVQAIVTQTLRTSSDPQAFSDAFTARLAALSQSHDVLTRNDWSGAFMHEILAEQLSPYERSAFDGRRVRSRFRLDGPDIKLSPNRAVTLSMAIGELATNAAKHGALSNGGSVEVAWSLESIEAAPWLSLVWRESGGPPVSPPSRTGFGTRLIERSLVGGLGGSARLDYAPDGLVCALKFPLIGDEA